MENSSWESSPKCQSLSAMCLVIAWLAGNESDAASLPGTCTDLKSLFLISIGCASGALDPLLAAKLAESANCQAVKRSCSSCLQV